MSCAPESHSYDRTLLAHVASVPVVHCLLDLLKGIVFGESLADDLFELGLPEIFDLGINDGSDLLGKLGAHLA